MAKLSVFIRKGKIIKTDDPVYASEIQAAGYKFIKEIEVEAIKIKIRGDGTSKSTGKSGSVEQADEIKRLKAQLKEKTVENKQLVKSEAAVKKELDSLEIEEDEEVTTPTKKSTKKSKSVIDQLDSEDEDEDE